MLWSLALYLLLPFVCRLARRLSGEEGEGGWKGWECEGRSKEGRMKKESKVKKTNKNRKVEKQERAN
jgi:hypothetical protein